MDNIEWAKMTFDPELQVNVHEMIRVMRGEVTTLSKDQWEDAKECCADIMEQFLVLRNDAQKLASNLQYYVQLSADLEGHFIEKNGLEAFNAFKAAREKQAA